MCNLVLTSEAYHAVEFRAAWMRFCSRCAQKVSYSPSSSVWFKPVITSEASRVVNSCSFMGIILFPYFNSTKGVKKTMASGNSRIRSSISPIWLDCSIRVYLNFALRKHEKLNNLLPQIFFCVYTSRYLIDTYCSFCVRAGGENFFAWSCSASFFCFFFLFLCSTGYVYIVRFIYQIIGQSNFALRKLSYFPRIQTNMEGSKRLEKKRKKVPPTNERSKFLVYRLYL